VLDTLVQPPNEKNISFKNLEVYNYSVARAPQYLGVVQEYLKQIFSGRILVGYHIDMKLADLELIDWLGHKNLVPNETLFDCAKMFNANPLSGQQWKLSDLCNQKLNLNFKKSTSATSFAVSFLFFIFKGN